MVDVDDILDWIVSSTGSTAASLSSADVALLGRVVGAVYAHVRHWYEVPLTDPLVDPLDFDQAVLMQSARLWQRRQSPTGIGAVNDFGPLRVTSLDPDVTALLAPYRIVNLP